jgi:hypothetical protein
MDKIHARSNRRYWNQPTRTDIQEEVEGRRRRRWFTFYRSASEAGKGKISFLRLELWSGSVAASTSRKGGVRVEELSSSSRPPSSHRRRPLRPSVPVTAAAATIARAERESRFVALGILSTGLVECF